MLTFFAIVAFALRIGIDCAEFRAMTTGHPFEDKETDKVHAIENAVQEDMSITFPGTKWCGPGNTANGYDDLGVHEDTDKCCRDHDHCENIPAGQEKHGLKNNDWFTRLHCDCDKQFYHCLHEVNSTVSNTVGVNYFGIRSKCYKEAYPVVHCLEYISKLFSRRCIKYQFETSQPMVYQWFDIPFYDTAPYPTKAEEDFKSCLQI